VNNYASRPQIALRGTRGVEKRSRPSTRCASPNAPLTRGFAESYTIHTPYYDYYISINTKDIRRRGTSCAYPS